MKVPVPTLIASGVSIQNLAIDPREDVTKPTRVWSPLAIPYSASLPEVADFIPAGSSERRLAVKMRNVGTHSTVYLVAGVWEHRDTFGDLVTRTSAAVPSFTPSDWVADDMTALVPKFELVFDSERSQILEPKNVTLLEQSTAHQVFRLVYSAGGHRAIAIATVYSGQDSVDLCGFYNWCDQTVPEWETRIQGFKMISGEYYAQDFASRSGSFDPIHHNGQWHTVLFTDVTIGDAQSFTFYGRLLCLPQTSPAFSTQMLEDQQLRIQTLLAQRLAPVQGVASPDIWKGKFLAFKAPLIPPLGVVPENDAFHYEVGSRENFKGVGRMTDPRPEGLAPSAGQTGGQFDFGAVKGWPALTARNAWWIHQAKFSVSEFLRGFLRYEGDDSILRKDGHPDWITWSQLTNERMSQDMLGKDRNRPYTYGTGWTGMDNQHRSQKLTAAYLALTGDPLVQEMIEHAIETDLARDQNHTDAARAAGRLLMTWSDFYTLVPEPVKAKILTCMMNYLRAYQLNWQGQGQICISETILDDRTGIVDSNGQAKPCWSVWGESIAAMGFWAAWSVTQLEDFRLTALALARSVVRNGVFLLPEGMWRVCTYVAALPEGVPLPSSAYTISPIGVERSITVGDEGWWIWTLPAVLILASAEGETTEDGRRAIEIARQKLGGGVESWNAAEWLACVDYTSILGG